MQFFKYPSIDKPEKQKRIVSEKYNVTEKVHGANFAIYIDFNKFEKEEDGWIMLAKRSGFLVEADAKQFPCTDWIKAHIDKLKQTAKNVIGHLDSEIMAPGSYLIIYGEFYGGWYPAKPAKWKGSQSLREELQAHELQHGAKPEPVKIKIYYSHSYEFICFDMVVVMPGYQPTRPDGRKIADSELFRHYIWLPYKFISQQPIPCVPIMFTGTFDECVKFAHSDAIRVNSLVAENIHGLEPLPPGTNIIEGVVISPDNGPHFPVKIKNVEFMETVQAPVKKHGKFKGHPFIQYITQNRWDAVRSKHGAISFEDLKKEFEDDALEEFMGDNPDAKLPQLSSDHIRNALDAFYAQIEK